MQLSRLQQRSCHDSSSKYNQFKSVQFNCNGMWIWSADDKLNSSTVIVSSRWEGPVQPLWNFNCKEIHTQGLYEKPLQAKNMTPGVKGQMCFSLPCMACLGAVLRPLLGSSQIHVSQHLPGILTRRGVWHHTLGGNDSLHKPRQPIAPLTHRHWYLQLGWKLWPLR